MSCAWAAGLLKNFFAADERRQMPINKPEDISLIPLR